MLYNNWRNAERHEELEKQGVELEPLKLANPERRWGNTGPWVLPDPRTLSRCQYKSSPDSSPKSSGSSSSHSDSGEEGHKHSRRGGRTGPLLASSRAKAAFMRSLGACEECRKRRVSCHRDHWDLTHFEMEWCKLRGIKYHNPDEPEPPTPPPTEGPKKRKINPKTISSNTRFNRRQHVENLLDIADDPDTLIPSRTTFAVIPPPPRSGRKPPIPLSYKHCPIGTLAKPEKDEWSCMHNNQFVSSTPYHLGGGEKDQKACTRKCTSFSSLIFHYYEDHHAFDRMEFTLRCKRCAHNWDYNSSPWACRAPCPKCWDWAPHQKVLWGSMVEIRALRGRQPWYLMVEPVVVEGKEMMTTTAAKDKGKETIKEDEIVVVEEEDDEDEDMDECIVVGGSEYAGDDEDREDNEKEEGEEGQGQGQGQQGKEEILALGMYNLGIRAPPVFVGESFGAHEQWRAQVVGGSFNEGAGSFADSGFFTSLTPLELGEGGSNGNSGGGGGGLVVGEEAPPAPPAAPVAPPISSFVLPVGEEMDVEMGDWYDYVALGMAFEEVQMFSEQFNFEA
ncbi:hypothetical protein QBC38DRAFT_448168 [Podospora fimiseda]|uniref:Uncharacterized protein n=1 Tax=Podospora fimiseda TaxID=252190 RepID=A0AAN7BG82_9PEZI|nr:hypothetical protein QBC38DRAFT_448168 [Podospora fimiseda]